MKLFNQFKTLSLAVLVLFTSCDDTNEIVQTEQPTPPPSYSLSPEFNTFEGSTAGRQASTIKNWLYAATNVTVYSSILTVSLAVPVAAFNATIAGDPIFNRDTGLWEWTSDFTVSAEAYQITLTADVNGSDVNWKGYISKENGFTDFIWFDGTSRLDGTSGSWSLYESPNQPAVWISSDWERDFSTNSGEATFMVEKTGNGEGSFITYQVDSQSDLDRGVIINDVNQQNEIAVLWNQAESYGRVRSQTKFGDTDFHCWDADLQDTVCQ